MPIIINQLETSDALSTAIEKINFNFDQILLAGGGPPGPIGPQGVSGVPGPQGERGDHWQIGGVTGPTDDHGPEYDSLQDGDQWMNYLGQVYTWNAATSTWVDSGVNLTGPAGAQGSTGGSLELGLYLGGAANALGNGWFPLPGVTAVDNSNVNFLIPLNAYKNNLFIGDINWAYNNLKNFNNWNGVNSGSYPAFAPKITIMQSVANDYGFGGISIGAYGMTSTTGLPSGDYYLGGTSLLVDARDFFNAGISVFHGTSLSHSFKASTNTIHFEIQSGNADSTINGGHRPNLYLRSNNIIFQGYTTAGINDSNNWFGLGPPSNYINYPTLIGYGGFGTFSSTANTKLQVNGNTTTTNFQMLSGAIANGIMISDSLGNASWTTASAIGILSGLGATSYLPIWTGTETLGSSIIQQISGQWAQNLFIGATSAMAPNTNMVNVNGSVNLVGNNFYGFNIGYSNTGWTRILAGSRSAFISQGATTLTISVDGPSNPIGVTALSTSPQSVIQVNNFNGWMSLGINGNYLPTVPFSFGTPGRIIFGNNYDFNPSPSSGVTTQFRIEGTTTPTSTNQGIFQLAHTTESIPYHEWYIDSTFNKAGYIIRGNGATSGLSTIVYNQGNYVDISTSLSTMYIRVAVPGATDSGVLFIGGNNDNSSFRFYMDGTSGVLGNGGLEIVRDLKVDGSVAIGGTVSTKNTLNAIPIAYYDSITLSSLPSYTEYIVTAGSVSIGSSFSPATYSIGQKFNIGSFDQTYSIYGTDSSVGGTIEPVYNPGNIPVNSTLRTLKTPFNLPQFVGSHASSIPKTYLYGPFPYDVFINLLFAATVRKGSSLACEIDLYVYITQDGTNFIQVHQSIEQGPSDFSVNWTPSFFVPAGWSIYYITASPDGEFDPNIGTNTAPNFIGTVQPL